MVLFGWSLRSSLAAVGWRLLLGAGSDGRVGRTDEGRAVHRLYLRGPLRIMHELLRIVSKVYECKVDNDLIICGVLLHDIYKTATYVEKGERYVMSDLAERVDHLTLASAELIRRGFPLDVVHIVVASHGREYGPMAPMTVEALICHLADYSEAKLNGDVLSAARFMIREITGEEPKVITGKEAFAIVSAKTEKGWNGVRNYLSKKRT